MINIKLNVDQEVVCLEMIDDGIGFEIDKIKKGIGFKNIQSRAQQIEGQFDIISSPGNGTAIRITSPIQLNQLSPLN